MINRILHALVRQFDVTDEEPRHFHPSPRGPYPCFDPECVRPGRNG